MEATQARQWEGDRVKRRSKAREIALKFLYQVDLRGQEVLTRLEAFLALETHEPRVQGFARMLILGALERFEKIDRLLQSVTRNWDLSRMAVIDRNILRLSVFEICHCEEIPPKVSINEAIELGKRFSTANSGAFINGILDRVKKIAEGIEATESSEVAGSTL